MQHDTGNCIGFPWRRAFYLIVSLACAWTGPVRAADHYVRPPGTCTNTQLQAPYGSWNDAATSIQWAVDSAMAALPAVVWVTNGAYRITNQVMITNSIVLRSVNGFSNTFVFADWPAYTTRCFYIVNTGVLDGFTISNGHQYALVNLSGGGGVYASNRVTVQNCRITDNIVSNGGTSAGGGGIYLYNSTVLGSFMVNNRVLYNSGAANAGGGAFLNTSSVISNCNVSYNYAYGGAGGIYMYQYTKAMDCTVISNNGGVTGCGGIYMLSGYLISNCFIAFNQSYYGGGLSLDNCALMIDCVVSNNLATQPNAGGGLSAGSANIRNCTIVNNRGGYGGIYLTGYLVSNCVIAGNTGTRGAGVFLAGSYNPFCQVDSCRISNNIVTAGPGGGGIGITNFGCVRNSLIHHNTNLSAAGNGGGVHMCNLGTNRTYGVINCTIVDNYSTNEGGGITALGISNYVANCVVAGNVSYSGNYPNVYFKDSADANRLSFYNSCVVTTNPTLVEASQGNITNDPALADDGSGRLGAGSPCINAGMNQGWMTNFLDLDGKTRIRYGVVDMGAFERVHEATIYNYH